MMKLGGEGGSSNGAVVASGSGGGDKSLPKDARVMTAILKDMNINDYEPRVVSQLLEFAYRYISTILEDSRTLSIHARKKTVDVDDVKMAVQMYAEHNLTSPPSRDVLLDVAAKKNAMPLPLPKTNGGLHLPPDRYCLTACNYKLKAQKKPAKGAKAAGFSATGPRGASASATKAKIVNSKQPVKINSMSKIQIQPQAGDGQPVFSVTVNPMAAAAAAGNASAPDHPVAAGVKRKADQMEQN